MEEKANSTSRRITSASTGWGPCCTTNHRWFHAELLRISATSISAAFWSANMSLHCICIRWYEHCVIIHASFLRVNWNARIYVCTCIYVIEYSHTRLSHPFIHCECNGTYHEYSPAHVPTGEMFGWPIVCGPSHGSSSRRSRKPVGKTHERAVGGFVLSHVRQQWKPVPVKSLSIFPRLLVDGTWMILKITTMLGVLVAQLLAKFDHFSGCLLRTNPIDRAPHSDLYPVQIGTIDGNACGSLV